MNQTRRQENINLEKEIANCLLFKRLINMWENGIALCSALKLLQSC